MHHHTHCCFPRSSVPESFDIPGPPQVPFYVPTDRPTDSRPAKPPDKTPETRKPRKSTNPLPDLIKEEKEKTKEFSRSQSSLSSLELRKEEDVGNSGHKSTMSKDKRGSGEKDVEALAIRERTTRSSKGRVLKPIVRARKGAAVRRLLVAVDNVLDRSLFWTNH